MRRTISRALMVGIACCALAAPVLMSAAPAGAGTHDCPAACIAGHYIVHFRWADDTRWIAYPLDLAEDHSGSFANGALPVVWTKGHGVFTMAFDEPGIVSGSYVGYRNQHDGFCNRQRYGTMSNSEGNTGIWYARPAATG